MTNQNAPEAGSESSAPVGREEKQMQFNLKMAQALVDSFGGDEETTMTVGDGDGKGHSGPGLYAWSSEYPDEGSVFLGNAE